MSEVKVDKISPRSGTDVTLSDEMRDYRQELRDLPAGLTTVEQVEAVVWPVE
jgi:hypothetical protein